MQLAKHVSQGKLTFLNQGSEYISIHENDYYRWLSFNSGKTEQVIQSVMLKRKPWKLTLPHQTVMMFPLLFFKPDSMVELGLGGGNIQRFVNHISNKITVHSIEHNCVVIDCFNQFFNPENNKVHIIFNDSKEWLGKNTFKYDWYICDIYQENMQSYENTITQLQELTRNILPGTCITINLPEASDNEVNLLLTILKEVSIHHEITYFHIPNYLNIIIHLIPKQWQTYKRIKRNNHSYLPKITFERWKNFWLHGKKLIE